MQTIENVQENDKEYDGNWKRRKIVNPEDENNIEMKEVQENNTENANPQKKADGDEKYDPLEADAESEEEEVHEAENNEQSSENVINTQEKKTPVDKMWADIDNDNEAEIGNLIDDGDEKEHVDHEKSVQKLDRENPQIKSTRGRGFTRGRGTPRARRARR